MKLGDVKARADRIQKVRSFKLIASAVILLAAIGLSISAVVIAASPVLGDVAQSQPGVADPGTTITNTDAAQVMLETVLKDARGPEGMIIASGIVAAGALIVVWLDLGLTYLALGIVLAVVAGPLWMVEGSRGFSKLVVAIVALAASFTALMQGLRILLGGKGPVRAIARNVLAEAVRLRLSIVFIVLLIFGLAALPGLLDSDQPLRYRVQSFMQFGTGGSFWIIAMLTVFFSVSTVSSEQRDKIIWQTMTKPVAPWKYLFGKWLGVAGLAGVLLAVSSSGVFLFVEYLRNQPAIGEKEAFIAYADQGLSEDRLELETQVLSAQIEVQAMEPEMDEQLIRSIMENTITRMQSADPEYVVTDEVLDKMRKELVKRGRQMYFAIPAGSTQTYVFDNVNLGPKEDVPLVLKYRVDAGANAPNEQYKISLRFLDLDFAPVVRDTGLGHSHTLPIAPLIVLPPGPGEPAPRVVLPDDPSFSRVLFAVRNNRISGAQYITAGEIVSDGKLALDIANGQFAYVVDNGQIVGTTLVPNPSFMQIPMGGLTLSYTSGSYHANYARVMGILWLKLAFLAMLGVFCSTFLSFPVASMMTFSVFLMAQSAGYVRLAIDNYATLDSENNLNFLKLAISAIAFSVSWVFKTYAELAPIEKLVNGQMVGGVDVLTAAGVIGIWCLVLFGSSVFIFRRRELAIYSGQ